MVRCPRQNCGWQSIAPSESAAREQYHEHLAECHTEEVAADVPEGMVQVKVGDDDEWRTVSVEEARRLHDRHHDEE